MKILSPAELKLLYRKRARFYDFSARLYYLAGYRYSHYRERGIEALRLKPGQTVIEIGCGTGINFPSIVNCIGDQGRLIGVDLTDAMLEQARKKIKRNNWTHVELVNTDATEYSFPDKVDAIISTFALSLNPAADKIITNGVKALSPGGRWVVVDMKLRDGWKDQSISFLMPVLRPFGITDALVRHRPWETIIPCFSKLLDNIQYTEFFFGFSYLISGEKA